MADFDPKAFLAEDDFDPKAFLADDAPEKTMQPEDGLLIGLLKGTRGPFAPERIATEKPLPVTTVQTPTGPARLDSQGRRVLSADEAGQLMDGGTARAKERGLEELLTFFGAGGKLVDEMAGANAAVDAFPAWAKRRVMGDDTGLSPADEYRNRRDKTRFQVAQATQKSPALNVGGINLRPTELAGAAAPSMGAGLPETALGRMLASGGAAAIDEMGASESADSMLSDMAKSFALGTLSGGVAEGLTAPLRFAARGAARESAAAKDVVEQGIQRAKDAAVDSAGGELRNIGTQQSNAMKHALNVLDHPDLFAPEVVEQARALVASPEGQRVINRGASNVLSRAPSLLGDEEAAKVALSQAVAQRAPGIAASEAAAKVAPGAVAADIAQKGVSSFGQRAALGAGGAALGAGFGALTGGDWKAWAGAGGLSGAMTAPGVVQFVRNTTRSPAVQSAANQVASKAFDAVAGGVATTARTLEPAASSTRTSNAFSEMRRRFGLDPQSEEEMADSAYLAGQTGGVR